MYYGAVEGTDIEVIDPRFRQCFAGHVRVERLWTGARWAEGPAWFAAGRYLIWSDIPNNRMMRLTDPGDSVSVFRERSNNSNGNTVDNQGRLVSCEHLTRRVTPHRDRRLDHRARRQMAGQALQLAERRGREVRQLDLVHRPGLRHRHRLRRRPARSRRSTAATSTASTRRAARSTASSTDMVRPNGIAFSPDEKLPLHRRHRRHARRERPAPHPPLHGLRRRQERSTAAKSSPNPPPASSTGFASTGRAASGRAPATACTASIRTAR